MKAYKWILCIVLVFIFSGCLFLFGNFRSDDSTVNNNSVVPSETFAEETPTAFTFTAEAFNSSLLQIVNAYREKNGLPAWYVDDGLSQAAQTRAGECAIMESKSHKRPDGSGWYTALGIQDESENYNYCEITGISDQSAATLLRTWVANDNINSSGLLSAEYTICGIGCEAVGSNVYCVLILYKE